VTPRGMTQRHAPRRRATPGSRNAGRGGTLLGIFIGLVLGLSIAAGVAFFLGRSGLTTPLPGPGASKDTSKSGKADLNASATAPDKPRFDFYKILPGAEETKPGTERRVPDKIQERPPERPPQTAKSAEPAPAVGALSGWEAAVQTVSLPDKTQRYRVRLGPYDNTDELNRVKTELGNRGFDVAVIKNQ
jgi:hypothetical protein